jgi:hypothetical protein
MVIDRWVRETVWIAEDVIPIQVPQVVCGDGHVEVAPDRRALAGISPRDRRDGQRNRADRTDSPGRGEELP